MRSAPNLAMAASRTSLTPSLTEYRDLTFPLNRFTLASYWLTSDRGPLLKALLKGSAKGRKRVQICTMGLKAESDNEDMMYIFRALVPQKYLALL
jgi:hypothetical protein